MGDVTALKSKQGAVKVSLELFLAALRLKYSCGQRSNFREACEACGNVAAVRFGNSQIVLIILWS